MRDITLVEMDKKMLRVSLCSLPVEGDGEVLNRGRGEGPQPQAPKTAIVNLIKMMERCGYHEDSWDYYDIDMLYPTDAEVKGYFTAYKPHVVGLSAVVSTSYSQVKRIARIIRSVCPKAWIVMGGALYGSSEVVLKNTEVDLCVCGDGEIAWIRLLDYIRTYPDGRCNKQEKVLSEINGVAFLDEKGLVSLNGFGEPIDAANIEFPDYEILASGLKGKDVYVKNYFRPGLKTGMFDFDERAQTEKWQNKNMASLFTSKGCVGRCTFCQRTTKGFRGLSLSKLDQHLKVLRDKYDIGFIKVLDECFGANREHGHRVAELFWKHGMLWTALTRVSCINEEDIVFYKRHGASLLRFGVETGSQKMLDIMGKGTTVSDSMRAVSTCVKYNMDPDLQALIGMPGETESTVAETGRLYGKIAALRGVHPRFMGLTVFYAMPIPGTPLWLYGQKVGVIPTDNDLLDEFLMRLSYAAFYKRYYVNITGAPIHEVLFWEYLFYMEASRSFRQNSLAKKKSPELLRMYEERQCTQAKVNPRLKLRYKELGFTMITSFVDEYVLGNRVVESIPRLIIYPMVKGLLYLEYIVQRMIPANKRFPIFDKRLRVERLTVGQGKSLRSMVRKDRDLVSRMSGPERVRYILNYGKY